MICNPQSFVSYLFILLALIVVLSAILNVVSGKTTTFEWSDRPYGGKLKLFMESDGVGFWIVVAGKVWVSYLFLTLGCKN